MFLDSLMVGGYKQDYFLWAQVMYLIFSAASNEVWDMKWDRNEHFEKAPLPPLVNISVTVCSSLVIGQNILNFHPISDITFY